jgi:membrane-associated phospholipid phosphatase
MKSSNSLYLSAVVLAVLAAAALLVDIPVARLSVENRASGDIRKLLNISEVFAHGFGVALILITVAVLDPSRRRQLPRVCACAFGAGIVAQLAKHGLPRTRPNVFDFTGDVWSTFSATSSSLGGDAGRMMVRGLQSFPSGHTATAVGLAFGLGWLYPRGRWLFFAFAALAAFQRIESSAHYVSDTLAGAAIACVMVGLCFDARVFGTAFGRLEAPKEGRRVLCSTPVSDSA